MPFVRSREDAEFVEQEMKLRRCFEVEYWGHETWFRIQPKNRDPQSLLCLAWFIEGMYHGMGRQPKGRDGMPLAKNFEDATFACRWAKRRFDDWKHIKPEVCCYYNDTTGMQSAVEDRGGTPDKGWAESIIAAFISGMYAERDRAEKGAGA